MYLELVVNEHEEQGKQENKFQETS